VLSRLLRRTSAVTLDIETEPGRTRSFPLGRRDAVYVLRPVPVQAVPTPSHVDPSSGLEEASQRMASDEGPAANDPIAHPSP
jgi:hypothetical protein